MSLKDVTKKYKKEKLKIDPKGNYISVNIDTGGIEKIEYHNGFEEKPDAISMIIVSKYDLKTSIDGKKQDNKNNNLSLLSFLQENLGHKEPCATSQYIWRIDDYRYVFFDEEMPYHYRIFFNNVYAPGTSSKCLDLINPPVIKKTL